MHAVLLLPLLLLPAAAGVPRTTLEAMLAAYGADILEVLDEEYAQALEKLW